MGTRSLLIGLISLCMTGCAPKQIEKGEIEKGEILVLESEHYFFCDDDERRINPRELHLYKEVKNDTLTFIYTLINKDVTYTVLSLSMFVNNASFVLVNDHKCPLIGEKPFIIDGREFVVSRYYFDEESWVDEECYVFINPDYGVLVVISEAWSAYTTYFIAHDNISNILVDAIIGGFYGWEYWRSPPPPPPPAELLE